MRADATIGRWAVAMAAASVAAIAVPGGATASGRRLVRADFPAALAAWPGGGLVYGELRTGRIWRVGAGGRRGRRPLVRVRPSTDGLKGLLGLAVDRHGRVYAAYTAADGDRLVVDRVAPGRGRRIWTGPPAATETNGGRLAFTPRGRLLVTVGDRLTSLGHGPPGRLFPPWPGFAGAVLSVDPGAGPRQRPRLLSGGWFNPYGLAVTPGGAVWAADNAPVGQPDHLARADLGGRPARASVIGHVAPAGLAAAGGDLYLCGYVSRRLDRYRIARDGRARRGGAPLAHDCSLGVVALADGRLAYANEHEIRVVRPPGQGRGA